MTLIKFPMSRSKEYIVESCVKRDKTTTITNVTRCKARKFKSLIWAIHYAQYRSNTAWLLGYQKRIQIKIDVLKSPLE
jgi:hypothetical protein